jgi:hypothetical protein
MQHKILLNAGNPVYYHSQTRFNSFKIRSCFLIPFMFLIKQKITVWRSRANTLAANRHILGRELCVNVLHSSQKNKITIFSSKTVFFIESFCTKLGRILKKNLKNWRSGTFIRSGGDAKQVIFVYVALDSFVWNTNMATMAFELVPGE